MELNNIFSFNRLAYLLKRNFVLNFKALLIAFSAIAGVIAIIGALSAISARMFNHEVFVGLFYVVFFVGGLILTSGIFTELHKPERSIHFLTLPASTFEKLLSAWLNTTIIYIIFAYIGFYVSYLFSSVFALWWFKAPLGWFNLFDAEFFKIAGVYIVIQSVFFFGAVYFRGYNFLKTILALFVLSFVHSVYQSIFGAAMFHELIHYLIIDVDIEEMVSAPGLEEYAERVILPLLKFSFTYLLPTFFLIMSYLRLKEREV